jgi:hypothetical protein
MRCRACDYTLFNLKARQCPECGAAFRPSDFEFVAEAVRFCCPHCDQAYFGTGERGHLVPPEFACVQCGQHVHMDDMVLRPAQGVSEAQAQAGVNPWLERARRGRLRAWFAVIGMAMTAPGKLMRATPETSSQAQAWWFAVLTTTVINIVAAAPILCVAIGMPLMIVGSRGQRGPSASWMASTVGLGMLLSLVGVIIASIVSIGLWALVVHGVLRLTGPCAHGLGRTCQAVCYSAGANALTAVPCMGQYFGWIWWVISAVLMVKEGQRVSGGRATLAVLAFPVVSIVVIVGVYGWIVVSSMNASAGRAAAAWPSSATASTDTRWLGQALLVYNGGFGGWPAHGIELINENHIGAAGVIVRGSATTELDVPVGDVSLAAFQYLPPNRRRQAAQALADALPRDVVAHRLGDFVFTYHGVDAKAAHPSLWLAVLWPDPGVSGQGPPVIVHMAQLDGAVKSVVAADFPRQLREQNQLRAQGGLPPLPDPALITHAAPARAGKP